MNKIKLITIGAIAACALIGCDSNQKWSYQYFVGYEYPITNSLGQAGQARGYSVVHVARRPRDGSDLDAIAASIANTSGKNRGISGQVIITALQGL